ncbi:MAG: LysM peptidoglycan-binding domain-containing protein [Gammaproteobacteria bacterium]|nr:LysM peptidoglycan-binding domain-containing protein [Gammaproteobacteria bacterium]
MNTPTFFTRYLIVTFLLSAGLSACSSTEKRPESSSPMDSQQSTESQAGSRLEEQMTGSELDASQQKQTTVRVKESHPRQYTVKKGDTLWDISSQFLRDPWFWPEIWHKNKQVQNPHLIYPGDVLTLIYVEGQPQIIVNGGQQQQTTHTTRTTEIVARDDQPQLRTVKLSPSVRKQGLDASVVTIPGDAIRQFLSKPRVVTKEELEEAPYILASVDNHLILGQDNRVYVRGELDKDRVRYTVFRPGKELVDPETDEVYGYEAVYAGEAHIREYGDPAVARLTSTEREVLIGDRLLPMDKSKVSSLYYPRTPDRKIKGQVISLFDALFGIAKFQIAVVNRGTRDGLEVGHLLATLSAGETVRDTYSIRERNDDVKLPDERSGLMMVFLTFDKVSYGLMLESTRVVNNYDTVVTPE